MSPAATFTQETAREAVLAAADRLFYERGIAAVGMAEVRDASGVSLRRLYALYSGKSELVAAWLHDRHDRWMAWFDTATATRVAAGAEPIVAVFDAIEEWAATPGFRGCAFVNALAETGSIDDVHRAIVADHKRQLVEHIGLLVGDEEQDWWAVALGALVDGAVVQAAVFGSTEPIAAARQAAIRLGEAL